MKNYYFEKLSAQCLKRCYEIAPPRVKQYLEAEIQFVLDHINPFDRVLELGCGYGRVIQQLNINTKRVIGIDTSRDSLDLAKAYLMDLSSVEFFQMNAINLGFQDQSFDIVIAIQNAISAFNVDQNDLIRESLRVTRDRGKVLFSSYSDKFWNNRLAWFELQAQKGLLGEIDWNETRDGIIVCKDGFKATTVRPTDFTNLAAKFNVEISIKEVDDSSMFCIMTPQRP